MNPVSVSNICSQVKGAVKFFKWVITYEYYDCFWFWFRAIYIYFFAGLYEVKRKSNEVWSHIVTQRSTFSSRDMVRRVSDYVDSDIKLPLRTNSYYSMLGFVPGEQVRIHEVLRVTGSTYSAGMFKHVTQYCYEKAKVNFSWKFWYCVLSMNVLLHSGITVTQLVKKFPVIYETWRFITVFTRARHWSLSW